MAVNVDIASCRASTIDIDFGYSPLYVAAVKTHVPGARFQKEPRKHWHAPLDMETCRALRRAFGDDLIIGPALRAWAFKAGREQHTLASLALADSVDSLDRLPKALPTLYEAVWLGPLGKWMTPEQRQTGLSGPGSFQAADVRFVAEAPAPLVGNEQGTGKTLTYIASVWEAGIEDGCHLVVCPKTAIDGTWEGELLRWQADAKKIVEVFPCVDDRGEREATLERFRKSTADVKWVVVNPAMVAWVKDPTRTSKITIEIKGSKDISDACYCSKSNGPHHHYQSPYPQLRDTHWRTVCVDEAHKGSVRNHRSITSKALSAAAKNADKRTIMTGTPMKKKGGSDIWGLLNWLRPDVFTSSWRFWGTYFNIEDNGYGKKVGELKSDMEIAFWQSLAPYVLRRLKSEVAPWLPEKMYVPVDCFMGPKQLKQYQAMEQAGAAELEGGEVSTTGVLAKFTRLKQFANALCKNEGGRLVPIESCKVEAMLDKMDETGMFDEGETRKQLVFSQSREMIDYTAAVLRAKGLSVEIISGKENKKSEQRKALIHDFQEGDLRVLCIVTTAGGVSLTLDAADEVHLLDEMWSPDEDVQAEDRAHRVSRIHQVTIFIYRTIGTIDQYIEETKIGKAIDHAFILDVRRELAHKWLAPVK